MLDWLRKLTMRSDAAHEAFLANVDAIEQRAMQSEEHAKEAAERAQELSLTLDALKQQLRERRTADGRALRKEREFWQKAQPRRPEPPDVH